MVALTNQNNKELAIIDITAEQVAAAALDAAEQVDLARRAVAARVFNVTLHVGDNSTTFQLAVNKDGNLEMRYDSAGPANFAAARLREALEPFFNVIDVNRTAAATALSAGAEFTRAKEAASARKFGLFGNSSTSTAPQQGADNNSRPEPGQKPTKGVFKGPK